MLKKLRSFVAESIAPEIFEEMHGRIAGEKNRANEAELSANRRYAEMVSKMDPFEAILKRFNGLFSEEFTKPDEGLNEQARLRLIMWAYQQKDDPSFNLMVQWVMNSAGNETVKRAPVTVERSMYGRAQIANMILLRDEVGRLSSLYEEELAKRAGPQEFDSGTSAE